MTTVATRAASSAGLRSAPSTTRVQGDLALATRLPQIFTIPRG